jgi:hypothetical protein
MMCSALLDNQYEVGQQVVVTHERGDEEYRVKMTLTADSR